MKNPSFTIMSDTKNLSKSDVTAIPKAKLTFKNYLVTVPFKISPCIYSNKIYQQNCLLFYSYIF